MCGGVHDVITGNKFHQNRSRGFRAIGVQILGSPIDLACRPSNSSALPCWLWLRHNLWRWQATVQWLFHQHYTNLLKCNIAEKTASTKCLMHLRCWRVMHALMLGRPFSAFESSSSLNYRQNYRKCKPPVSHLHRCRFSFSRRTASVKLKSGANELFQCKFLLHLYIEVGIWPH